MLNETGKSYGTKGGVATMKTADKSFSSKAMKVLLSIALVIGLAPAISPAKAYAADQATHVTIDGGTTEDAVTAGKISYSTSGTDAVLTVKAPVKTIAVAAEHTNSLTIKAESATGTIGGTSAAALTMADAA
ncbi:MAG: hypothetical protein RR671_04490, partial [Raoultibacter sp.]